jgi:hypothetical protein
MFTWTVSPATGVEIVALVAVVVTVNFGAGVEVNVGVMVTATVGEARVSSPLELQPVTRRDMIVIKR